MAFKLAKKLQSKLKIALYGPSGSGKTLGALKIAKGLVGPKGRIAVIDSERGSSALYEKYGPFEVDALESFEAKDYIHSLKDAVKNDYDVLIIDQITSEWESIKEAVDEITLKSDSGNSYAAWKCPSADHKRFINALITAPIHIISTIREKDEVIMEKNENGKLQPMKVGVKADQRKGVEYEFTTIFHIDKHHVATVEKDRTEMFEGFNDRLTEGVGQLFLDWLSSGVESPETKKASKERKNFVHVLLNKLNLKYDSEAVKNRLFEISGKESMTFWTESDCEKVIENLESAIQKASKVKPTLVEPKQPEEKLA